MSGTAWGSRFRRRLAGEPLETRLLLASLWQAAPNPYDVDNSGLVAALDVLLVVNDINQQGVRSLPDSQEAGYSGPWCDVNGDGRMSALDALLIVNVINQNPDPPSLSAGLAEASDPNGDEVVLSSQVVYTGVTAANAHVALQLVDGNQAVETVRVSADAQGRFEINTTLPAAINHVRLQVTDVRGRQVATERVTKVGDVVAAWNAAFLEVVRETTNVLSTGILLKPPPPMVSKYLAMVHGAMFDAINATTGNYHGYAFESAQVFSQASPVAAAAQAAHVVSAAVYSTAEQLHQWDVSLAEILASIPDGDTKTAGLALGTQVGQAMLAARAEDGSAATSSYSPSTQIGRWQPTAPSFEQATLPQWPEVTPFAMTSGAQFRPAPPPTLDSQAYADSLQQVMSLGSRTSSARTADQTDIARFWADGGGTATPPGHWNQIAIDNILQADLNLEASARTMALLNYALADAGISSWDAKYYYDLWRPITAIHQANQDGNSLTTADGLWQPLLVTPAFPTYTSGHSTFSGAAAAVLTELLGDQISFSSRADRGSSGAWPPLDDVSSLSVRSFDSFWDAAQEAGMSRIYGGIHFSFDNLAGLESGAAVGQWALEQLLLPKTAP